jgi:hypothetical protein
MKLTIAGRYLVAGTIAGALLTGVALAHDASDDDISTSALPVALQDGVESPWVPIAHPDGSTFRDQSGRVALVRRDVLDALLVEIGKESGGGVKGDDVAATVRIADHFDRLVELGGVVYVTSDDPRLLDYCIPEARAAGTCGAR